MAKDRIKITKSKSYSRPAKLNLTNMPPAMKPTKEVETLDPHYLFDSRPTFSHVATTTGPSRVITTAGQVGADSNGQVPTDYDTQVALAFSNLRRALEAAGASVKNVMKLTYYIVNYELYGRRYFKHLYEFLDGHRPATTLIPVMALAKPEFLFEVEALAAVRQVPLQKVDVVVVGAGISGLQAAHDIQKAGFSCVVLEARDRVGGKTLSVDPLGEGKVVDLGAAWINSTNQSKIFAMTKEFGLKTVIQNTVGDVVMYDLDGSVSSFPYGGLPKKLLPTGGAEGMLSIRDRVEEMCQKLDLHDPVASGQHLDKYSLEEYARIQGGGEAAIETVKIWTRVMLGLEPSQISALFFLDYCKSGGGLNQMRSDREHGGQYLRLVEGTQSFSKCLADRLEPASVILGSPVRSIRQTGEGIYVTAGRGDYQCQRVVVSVPTPLYKEITFDPPLPKAKRELSSKTVLGCTIKVILMYQSPWWRTKNLTGIVQSFESPVVVARDTSVDERKQFSLTCFVVGEGGLKWAKNPKEERWALVHKQVKEIFSPFVEVPHPVETIEMNWVEEQWSQGCPCPAMPPGVMTSFGHALRTPHRHVHFVGTETAYEWKGYMEGAARSGERGAKEVIQAFNQAKL